MPAASKPSPTSGTYSALDRAYAAFNRGLFAGSLPERCLITYQRHRGAYGFFHGSNLQGMGELDQVDEIALNPATFHGRTKTEILSTLVHEMVHLWQHHFGKPSRHGYHNKQWAEEMCNLGLIPSDTGKRGGKMTGQRMSHYIKPGGPFSRACSMFLLTETMPLFGDVAGDDEARKKKAASKTRYTCPDCETNAWAKPDTLLVCGECDTTMVTQDQLTARDRKTLIDLLDEKPPASADNRNGRR